MYLKKLFVLTLVCLFSLPIYAQEQPLLNREEAIQKIAKLEKIVKSIWYTNLDSAKLLSNNILSLSQKNNYLKGEAKAYNLFGVIYDIQGNFDQSINYYKKAGAIFLEIDDKQGLAITEYHMALVLQNDEQFSEALNYVEKAREYYEKQDLKAELAKSIMTIGNLYLTNNKGLENAIHKMKEAELIAQGINDTILIATALSLQGDAYVENKQFLDSAAFCFEAAIGYLKKKQNHYSLGFCYLGLAKAHLLQNNFDLAILNNDLALGQYKILNQKLGFRNSYNNRKDIYIDQRDFEKAVNAYRLLKLYSDSLYNENSSKQINLLKTEYETEKKEAEIESLSQKSEIQTLQLAQQNYMLVGSGVFILFIIIGGTLLYKQRKTKQSQALTAIELEEAKKRLEIEKQFREAELKAIRSQMNPHFIFNALNSIQEYIMSNEKKLAGKYLGKFADLMRIYLEHSKTNTITVNEEIKTLNLYLELEKLRFEDSFECTVEVNKNVDTHLLTLPTLLLQPFVENAIKHGLLHKKNNRKLYIIFSCEDENKVLQCEIIDNGVGRLRAEEINKMRNPSHKSFATSATKTRLDLLNYTKEHMISVETIDLIDNQENPTGTKVIISVPI